MTHPPFRSGHARIGTEGPTDSAAFLSVVVRSTAKGNGVVGVRIGLGRKRARRGGSPSSGVASGFVAISSRPRPRAVSD